MVVLQPLVKTSLSFEVAQFTIDALLFQAVEPMIAKNQIEPDRLIPYLFSVNPILVYLMFCFYILVLFVIILS